MSLSNRSGEGEGDHREVQAYFANRNPLLLSSLIHRQVALDASHLHSLLSLSLSPVRASGVFAFQRSHSATHCMGEGTELSLLRTWSRVFPSCFAFDPRRLGDLSKSSQWVSFSKILHVGEQAVSSEVTKTLQSDPSLRDDDRNVVELFALYLAQEVKGSSSADNANTAARRQLDSFFAFLMTSWGIPLAFRLSSMSSNIAHDNAQSSIREVIMRCIQQLSEEEAEAAAGHSDDDDVWQSSSRVCIHLEAICRHIFMQLFCRTTALAANANSVNDMFP
jgi:hypothetical protein